VPDAFDQYHRWLGISPKDQPPNHYRLLGVDPYETDPSVIESAADRQMAHVRTFQAGKHSALSQRILNELAAAKLTLLHPEKRAAYDETLRAETGTGEPVAEPRPAPKGRAIPLPASQAIQPAGPQVDVRVAERRRSKPGRRQMMMLGYVLIGVVLLVYAVNSGVDSQVIEQNVPRPETPPQPPVEPPVEPPAKPPQPPVQPPVEPPTPRRSFPEVGKPVASRPDGSFPGLVGQLVTVQRRGSARVERLDLALQYEPGASLCDETLQALMQQHGATGGVLEVMFMGRLELAAPISLKVSHDGGSGGDAVFELLINNRHRVSVAPDASGENAFRLAAGPCIIQGRLRGTRFGQGSRIEFRNAETDEPLSITCPEEMAGSSESGPVAIGRE